MKKGIGLIGIIAGMLSMTLTAFAGSIPEDLLHEDSAQIFFAEVLAYAGEDSVVTVCPVKKIKGETILGTQQHYDRANAVGDFKIRPGNVYLFTCFDENNPTDIFEVTSYDTSTLKIKNTTGDMWKRFEKYLNEGEYEKAEQERINKINARYTEVGDAIPLAALTETNTENCSKVEMSLFGKSEVYEIDKSKFYELAEDIRLVDIENVLVMDVDDSLVIRCYDGAEPHLITIWDNCTASGSRAATNSAPTGDYIIKAEDYNALLSLLPEEAQPKLPPLRNLYANFMYWFIFNSTTAYIIAAVIFAVLIGTAIYFLYLRKKHKKRL
ncbi:MAG: hypothetical protein IJN25_09885 [Clostridia bacterium]|nr:hypothetical protein [Clostridia bacterium]